MRMKIRKTWMRAAALLAVSAIIISSLAGCVQEQEETVPIETEPVATEALQSFEFPDFDPVWGTTAYPGEYSKGYDVVIDYAYSDRYFDFASTLYNPSLATMSLCMQLSSWSSYEVKAWAGKTRNVRKLMSEIGFTDYAQNEFWREQPSLHSIGVVAARKQFEDYTLIALPVRGGNYYNEWGNNVALGLEGYHTGFAQARDNVIAFLEDYITDCNITGRIKLWVTGYSRGGAVANLVAGYLNQNELPNGATLAFEDLYCYTFEAPQGALLDTVGEDLNHANIHNIVNANDVVTMVGPVDWGFSRYNTTTRLIPTVTTAQFESARDTMLEEFAEVLAGAPVITKPDATAYRVSEYAKTLQIEFDPMHLLSPDGPVLEIKVVDDTRQTMNEMLTRFVSCLVDSVGGRDVFYGSLQSDLVLLVELLKGYETGFDMDEVLDAVLTALTKDNYENLKYVIAPVFAMSGDSREERIEQVVARLHEVLPQPEGFADLYGTAGTLIQAIGNMLVNYPEEVLDVALAFTNSNVMQAHHQELTLAWVRAGDPHYTDTPWTMAVPEVLRSITVNSPDGISVNVEVYDSTGTLAASMYGDVVYRISEAIGCARNENGEIILHLPADEEYRILTDVAADGTVNIILSEYNVARSQVTRMQNYAGVSVKAGDTLTLEVPNLVEEEFTDEAQQGSTAEYRLLSGGEEQPCQEQRGQEIDDTPIPREYDTAKETEIPRATTAPAQNSSAGTTQTPVTRCVKCQAVLSSGTSHAAACGTSGHYSCDGADHSGLACGHHACGGGNHGQLDCGHYACAGGDHTAASCGTAGHYHCSGTHTNAACNTSGHLSCDGGNHDAAGCGGIDHYNCSGTHDTAGCNVANHYVCDGLNHFVQNCGHPICTHGMNGLHATARECGHFGCAEGDHSICAVCGQPVCDGNDHSSAACGTEGHYNCSGDHGTAACGTSGHYACDGGNHTAYTDKFGDPCGHYNCDESVATLTHDLISSCNLHHQCDSSVATRDHSYCNICRYGKCSDQVTVPHGAGSCDVWANYTCKGCGVNTGDAGAHYADCYPFMGHYTCTSAGDHSAYDCLAHYKCDTSVESLNHGECQYCGDSLCDGSDHTPASCGTEGHSNCDYLDHSALACGHSACAEGTHDFRTCQVHYGCDATVSVETCENVCSACNQPMCNGTDHTLAACGKHHVSEDGDHSVASCGHYPCDGGNHETALCGIHLVCAGGEHGTASCGTAGHYACDGNNHTACTSTEQ